MTTSGSRPPTSRRELTAAQAAPATEARVWRYIDMCRHWGVSRDTVERWVRRYEETGVGIPVHRDPSGRPYWLAEEAAADVVAARQPVRRPMGDDERLRSLRRAARRGYRAG